jgi:AraC family transcriptional regulator
MDHRVRRTIEFLESLGYEAVSVTRLATRVGLGYSRLAHLFKRDTTLSIRCFITARNLEHAAELIVSTESRVSEILYSVGFRDPANFAHAFKRRFGVSPREYRARARSTQQKTLQTILPLAPTSQSREPEA